MWIYINLYQFTIIYMNTLLNYDFTIVWYSLHQFGMSWSFFSRASIECEFNGGLASAANKVFLFGTSLLIDPVRHGDQERSFHIRLHRVACQGEFQASLLSTQLAKQLMPPGSTPTARPSPWNCRHLIRGYIKLQIFTWLILIAKLHSFTHWSWLSAKLWAPFFILASVTWKQLILKHLKASWSIHPHWAAFGPSTRLVKKHSAPLGRITALLTGAMRCQ